MLIITIIVALLSTSYAIGLICGYISKKRAVAWIATILCTALLFSVTGFIAYDNVTNQDRIGQTYTETSKERARLNDRAVYELTNENSISIELVKAIKDFNHKITRNYKYMFQWESDLLRNRGLDGISIIDLDKIEQRIEATNN